MGITNKPKTAIKPPYTDALTTLKGLMILPLLLAAFGFALQTAGYFSWDMVFYMMGGVGLSILVLSLIIIQIRRAMIESCMTEFLNSSRPLVQWSYSPEEWKQMREMIWKEEKEDWRIQMGCLTILFGLTGLLTGIMIGADHGFSEAVLYGLIGLIAGLFPGAVTGAVVSQINRKISRRRYADMIPAHVALGNNEILFNDEYFKGNGASRYIQDARFGNGKHSSELIISLWWPQIKTDPNKEWIITVPKHMLKQVESVLDRIPSHTASHTHA